ncbi:MAG TPA: hemerythrin domain-containing protein [Thermomicrobiales bacterium]|nr:hemerythrin domain-containing protein [Thermomicrobiales bacterium]
MATETRALPTQPLREEHQELLPHIDQLRVVADGVGTLPGPELRRKIEEVRTFLVDHLLRHARAEEAALYPVVARALGAPGATATMRRDHVEIGRLTAELGALLDAPAGAERDAALRRVLYGLDALVRVHFAKEEEVYLPILDERLTPAEARDLFAALERAAHA